MSFKTISMQIVCVAVAMHSSVVSMGPSARRLATQASGLVRQPAVGVSRPGMVHVDTPHATVDPETLQRIAQESVQPVDAELSTTQKFRPYLGAEAGGLRTTRPNLLPATPAQLMSEREEALSVLGLSGFVHVNDKMIDSQRQHLLSTVYGKNSADLQVEKDKINKAYKKLKRLNGLEKEKKTVAKVQDLIRSGVNLNDKTVNGETSLNSIIKSRSYNAEAIKALLDAGANPNITDDRGKTPLFHVLLSLQESSDSPLSVQHLINAGASLKMNSDDGRVGPRYNNALEVAYAVQNAHAMSNMSEEEDRGIMDKKISESIKVLKKAVDAENASKARAEEVVRAQAEAEAKVKAQEAVRVQAEKAASKPRSLSDWWSSVTGR